MQSTPMLTQYHAIKNQHKNCILLFRLGDFYEMFYDDAKVASRRLDLVLTARGKPPSEKIPMCGFPYHAADQYIARLINTGHKVAICEQLEDPALAKGLVKRDVTRIITSGTFVDTHGHARGTGLIDFTSLAKTQARLDLNPGAVAISHMPK